MALAIEVEAAAAPAQAAGKKGADGSSRPAPKPKQSHPGRRRGPEAPAIAAARAGDLEALRRLPAEEVLAAADHNGCGCLHWAAGNGHLEACRFLVDLIGGQSDHVLTWNQRTPLHYAARNGQLHVCRWLHEEASADVDALARDEVSPLQLAVWQNHLETCRWFVEDARVDPLQRNRFGCSIAHWLAQAPRERAGEPQGAALLPLARWLRARGCDFGAVQEHGHTALHKAAWNGHSELCRWLRDECLLRDERQDEAGNFAADLAEMGGHRALAAWLRAECSAARAASCRVLGVAQDADERQLREAYLRLVRHAHPDSQRRGEAEEGGQEGGEDFVTLHLAYRHLVREGGRGSQRNPRHEARLALPPPPPPPPEQGERRAEGGGEEEEEAGGGEDDDLCHFKARLLTVIREHGCKGLPVSSLRKKYAQVWSGAAMPAPTDFGLRKGCGLLEMVRSVASDVVRVELPAGAAGQDPMLHAIDLTAACGA